MDERVASLGFEMAFSEEQMKIQNVVLWLSLLFFMAIVSSCAWSNESMTTPTVSIAASSATPTLIPVATNTLSPSLTPIALPTLPVEEAGKQLIDLLANNGNCRLPCLWGVTLGKSTYHEFQTILTPLSSISQLTGFKPGLGSISPIYIEGNLMLIADVSFLSENEIVNHIAFRVREMKKVIASNGETGVENVFDSKSFGERARYYMLSNVLAEQGVPTSVMIAAHSVSIPQGGSGGFDILLLYPDQGVLVNYTTQMQLIGANVRGCPSNAHVEMELYPPAQSDSFFEALKKTDWAVKMDYYKPLEEVVSMSVQEFYKTFREPTDKCIETPAKVWPTPEP